MTSQIHTHLAVVNGVDFLLFDVTTPFQQRAASDKLNEVIVVLYTVAYAKLLSGRLCVFSPMYCLGVAIAFNERCQIKNGVVIVESENQITRSSDHSSHHHGTAETRQARFV